MDNIIKLWKTNDNLILCQNVKYLLSYILLWLFLYPTVKYRNTVVLLCMGVAKTKKTTWKCSKPYSWFIHRLSSKFYFVDIFKIPHKIKQNPKSSSSNHLSYHISSKHTKIKYLNYFTTKKSNFHLAKNLHTNLKSSLFIGTFTDNHFPSKNSNRIHTT